MKFIQRMLSHGLLIAIVVVAGLAYWYRADLFPERFGPQARTVAGKPVTEAPPEALSDDPITTDSMPVIAAQAESEAKAKIGNQEATVTVPMAPADLPPMQDAAEPQFRPLEGDDSYQQADDGELPPLTTDRNAVTELVPAVPPLSSVETPAAAEPEYNTPVSTSPEMPGVQQASGEPPMQAAREAFWQHDFTAAEDYYLQLAKQEPGNPDAYGELGNLYYQQGQWQQAADAYSKAAQRLLDQGDTYTAQHLLRVLWNLDQDQARQLEAMLKAAIAPE